MTNRTMILMIHSCSSYQLFHQDHQHPHRGTYQPTQLSTSNDRIKWPEGVGDDTATVIREVSIENYFPQEPLRSYVPESSRNCSRMDGFWLQSHEIVKTAWQISDTLLGGIAAINQLAINQLSVFPVEWGKCKHSKSYILGRRRFMDRTSDIRQLRRQILRQPCATPDRRRTCLKRE